jgi:hypothetical protein
MMSTGGKAKNLRASVPQQKEEWDTKEGEEDNNSQDTHQGETPRSSDASADHDFYRLYFLQIMNKIALTLHSTKSRDPEGWVGSGQSRGKHREEESKMAMGDGRSLSRERVQKEGLSGCLKLMDGLTCRRLAS